MMDAIPRNDSTLNRSGSTRRPERADDRALEALLQAIGDPANPLPLRRWIDLAEAWYIARTLHSLRGNRSAAARALGIGRRTLYAKMQKLGIEASWQAGDLDGLR